MPEDEFSPEFLKTDELWCTMRDLLVDVREIDPSYITPDARFKEELAAESLDAIEVIEAAEKIFEIKIPDEALVDLIRVADLYFLIRDLKAEAEES